MSALIILIVFIVLWLLVEIFSVALKMTGLSYKKARFQIISIITHTGFTTRESELIVQHKTRRKIASILMLVSYISQVTLISLFVNILAQNQKQLIYIGLFLVLAVILIVAFTRSKIIQNKFNHMIEKIVSKGIVNQSHTSLDKILQVSNGYGVYEIVLEEKNFICDNSLGSANLTAHQINVLKVDRGSDVYDFPDAKFVLQQGDRLILYGKTEAITKIFVDSSN